MPSRAALFLARRFCLALPLLFTACSSLPEGKPDPVGSMPKPLVSGLKEGQSLHIHLQSSGCFQMDDYRLTIVPKDNGYLVTGSEKLPGRVPGKTEKVLKETALIPTVLTSSDALGLDRLFEFYRHIPKGSCTTIDNISLQTKAGNTVIGQVTFEDDTCRTYNMPKVLSVPTLVRRMKPPEKGR